LYRKAIGFRPYVFDKLVEGEVFRFYVASPTGDAWYGRNSDTVNLEMRYVKEHFLVSGLTVLECGGHHGCDTVLFAKWVGPHGRVITFEPIIENTAVIYSNIALNRISNVRIEESAVGSTPGSVVMSRKSNASVRRRGGVGIQVPIVTLDDYCEKYGVFPDVLKIDVEGFEFEVLKGAKQLILDRRPMIQIEIHCDLLPRYGSLPEEIWNHVDRSLYDVVVQFNDLEQPTAYDATKPLRGRVHLFMRPHESAQS
jgi:FkbM family methyltransferase